MKNYAHYIGADVSKKTVDIHVLTGKEKRFHLRIGNDEKGFKMLEEALKQHDILAKDSLFCLENTGLYGWGIASWAVASQHLFTLRNRLVTSKKRLLTPLKETEPFIATKHQKELQNTCNPALKGVKKSIKEVERKITQLIKSDSKLAHMTDIITSIDGVGTQTATALIVATNEFAYVKTARGLACYAGVAPFEHTSGTSVRGKQRTSSFANKELKALLHLCTLSLLKTKNTFSDFIQRKKAAGKHMMSILNALRNKLLHTICACVRKNQKYEKNYTRKVA